jgi:putative nucleotidyltransferase with HDIG domain
VSRSDPYPHAFEQGAEACRLLIESGTRPQAIVHAATRQLASVPRCRDHPWQCADFSVTITNENYQIKNLLMCKTCIEDGVQTGLATFHAAEWRYHSSYLEGIIQEALTAVYRGQHIESFVARAPLADPGHHPNSIDLSEPVTREHEKRVANLSVALAEVLDLPLEQAANIELGALVHDVGKMGIPDTILNKPGKLTPHEWSQMQTHTVIGYEMLRHREQFRKCVNVVRWHHERWDGHGYPDGLKGESIPLDARIVCVADAFEAMTADRAYRTAMSFEEAFALVEEGAGTKFDPNIVPVFRAALERAGRQTRA